MKSIQSKPKLNVGFNLGSDSNSSITKMNRIAQILASFSAVFVLAGCNTLSTMKNELPGSAAQKTGLNTQQDRITEERVFADRKTIDALQQRLRQLNESGVSQNYYPLAKAQCWLDTAKTQYHENDRTGYIEESLTESSKIIQALEGNKSARVGYETPLVARSTRLRDDLWVDLAKQKNNPSTIACNAQTVACAEVRLVRAGHAEEQTGWRAAVPHVMMVEDGLRRANDQALACAPAPLIARAAPAAPQAAPVQPITTVREVYKETYVVLADALFKFDKSKRNEMLPGGIDRLSDIARRLKSYQTIDTLSIVGHTDRLGSDEYNDPLSARRASTVASYLSELGVKANKIDASGRGKRQPVTTDCSASASREKQIICLQPDRRVTIEVTGIVK